MEIHKIKEAVIQINCSFWYLNLDMLHVQRVTHRKHQYMMNDDETDCADEPGERQVSICMSFEFTLVWVGELEERFKNDLT